MRSENCHGTAVPVRAAEQRVAKLVGADVELGNFLESPRAARTGRLASRMILREVPGIARTT